jgi:hypothetical protein
MKHLLSLIFETKLQLIPKKHSHRVHAVNGICDIDPEVAKKSS